MKNSLFVLSLLIPSLVCAQELKLKTISSLDLKDAKLSLDLTAEQLKITGSLPKACAEKLTLSDIQRFESSKSSEELNEVLIENKGSLKEYATTIQALVTYSSDEQYPNLSDCLAKNIESTDLIDLSKDPRFSRTVSLRPEMAIAGLLGEEMTLKSPEFLKMEKQVEKLDCKDCNSNWKLVSSHLDEARGFDSPLLRSMMNKLLEDALTGMDAKVEEVTTLASLERARDQVVEMGNYASTDHQRDLILGLFEKINIKNQSIASTGFKTASMATRHADFSKVTFTKMSAVPGLTEDKKASFKESAASMGAGKAERLQFLSSIDGDHPEVRTYLKSSEQEQHNLQAQMQNVCMGPMNQHRFTQCGELQNQFNHNQQQVSTLQSKYTAANNQNWNSIFTQWDQKQIAYNQQWRTSFIQPVMGISSNSMPDMYDPKDSKYAQFDASQLYQINGMNNQSPNLYQQQPWVQSPIVR